MKVKVDSRSNTLYCMDALQDHGEANKLEIIATIWGQNNRSGRKFIDCQIAFNGRDTYYECEIFTDYISKLQLLTFCEAVTKKWRQVFANGGTFEEYAGEVVYLTLNHISECCGKAFGNHRHHIFLRQGFERNTKVLKCLEGVITNAQVETRVYKGSNSFGMLYPILNWPGTYYDAL